MSDDSSFLHLPELGVMFCRFSHGCSHSVGHWREIFLLLFQMETELNSLYLFSLLCGAGGILMVWGKGCMSESLAFWGSVSATRLVTIFWVFFPGQSLALTAINYLCLWNQPRPPSSDTCSRVGLPWNLSCFTAVVQPGSWGCENRATVVSPFILGAWENKRQGGFFFFQM